jgi:predicted phage tail protein
LDAKTKACVVIPVCESNPCSKFATCKADKKNAATPVCTCLDGFAGDGKVCKVKDGHKAVMLAGKLQIVPIRPGDTHDGDLAVIEAMLAKMAADGEQPTVVSAPSEKKGAEPNADDQSKLLDVTKKVASLEETARMMAEQTKIETAALMKLKESAAASKAEFLKAMEATTEKLADKVIDATHEAMLPSKKK